MAAPGTIHGAIGQVKYTYRTAAVVNDFTIARSELEGLTMRGTLAESDTYLLTQTPLTFVVPIKGGAWRWPVVDWRIIDRQILARLGAPLAKGE